MDKTFSVKSGSIRITEECVEIHRNNIRIKTTYDNIQSVIYKRPAAIGYGEFRIIQKSNQTSADNFLLISYVDSDLFLKLKHEIEKRACIGLYEPNKNRTEIELKRNIFKTIIGLLCIILAIIGYAIGIFYILLIIGILISGSLFTGASVLLVIGIHLIRQEVQGICPSCGTKIKFKLPADKLICYYCKNSIQQRDDYLEEL